MQQLLAARWRSHTLWDGCLNFFYANICLQSINHISKSNVNGTIVSSLNHCSYYSNEVDNYGSPYGYSQSVSTPQTIGYDISADFVDSTTAYEPRNNTIIDADFIGLHSTYPIFSTHTKRDFPLVV